MGAQAQNPHCPWTLTSTSFLRSRFFAFVGGFWLAGCANPIEKTLVAQRFQDLHGCPGAKMHSGGDRWIVEGCGIRAHYVPPPNTTALVVEIAQSNARSLLIE